jgi:hypothetical protein
MVTEIHATGEWWIINTPDFMALEHPIKDKKGNVDRFLRRLHSDKYFYYCRTCEATVHPLGVQGPQALALLAEKCTCKWRPTKVIVKVLDEEPYFADVVMEEPKSIIMAGNMAMTPESMRELWFG